jgi:hypothetical protein
VGQTYVVGPGARTFCHLPKHPEEGRNDEKDDNGEIDVQLNEFLLLGQ